MYTGRQLINLADLEDWMRSDDFTCAVTKGSRRRGNKAQTLEEKLISLLHDPHLRQLVGHVEEWELRVFAETSPLHEKLALEGLLHIQLWNQAHHVSVVTPSVFTSDAFEISPIKGKPFRSRDLERIRVESIGQFGLWIPSAGAIQDLERAWATDAPARGPI